MCKSFEDISHFIRFISFNLLIGLISMSFTVTDKAETLTVKTEENCPTASFAISNNGYLGPCEINFINQSQNATTYHWDFGDGTTSTEENPKHTYATEGNYTVTLTAIIEGCAVPYIGIVDVLEG